MYGRADGRCLYAEPFPYRILLSVRILGKIYQPLLNTTKLTKCAYVSGGPCSVPTSQKEEEILAIVVQNPEDKCSEDVNPGPY